MLVECRGWLIEYLGKTQNVINASNLSLRDTLGMLDKGDGEILKAVQERRLFISVNSSVVYDLTVRVSNNDLVTLFPIGTGG